MNTQALVSFTLVAVLTLLQQPRVEAKITINTAEPNKPELIDANEVWSAKNNNIKRFIYKNEIPADCPFDISEDITGLVFTGRYANYTTADTWYPSWATDGNMYSPWTDGRIHGIYTIHNKPECHSSRGFTGQAKIEGDDPMNLKIISLGTYYSPTMPYKGRYPCGSLVYNGIWYYGTYALNSEPNLNWPIMGTFPGFRISYDFGKTWKQTPLNCTPGQGLFPEPDKINKPVKFGAPHFVDFGKNMQYSPDGKAYLVAHGAIERDGEDRKANLSWITADRVYLCRVMPSEENINDESKYEYFAGHDEKGNPTWSWDFNDVEPLVEWDNNCGCVTITYNAPLKKYFMCVTDGWPTNSSMNTYILESNIITGPWKIVIYMKKFANQGYFINIPTKFISQDGKKLWLCYSSNYTYKVSWTDPDFLNKITPQGSTYSMSLHEVEITTR